LSLAPRRFSAPRGALRGPNVQKPPRLSKENTMSKIKPFCALRPKPEQANAVASPPYDVLSSDEARVMAKDNPLSFLHVSKPEIDLDPKIDQYADAVYAKAAENMRRMVEGGVYFREDAPCLYLYQQEMRIGDRLHVQVGLVAGASSEEYEKDLIKKHELTRADKEKDRTRHVETLNANGGPVFLTYRAVKGIDAMIDAERNRAPLYDFVSPDGIRHVVWIIREGERIRAFADAFAKLPCLYIADGHHRCASGVAIGAKRRAANPCHTGEEEYAHFLAVMFPHDQLYIMDYNRVVLDLNGLDEQAFLAKVREKFDVAQTTDKRPAKATEFGMFLGGKWYRLHAKPGTFDAKNPVESLDVSILQNNLLAPILGIGDPRRDKRIDFVGGIRGPEELERRVREGAAVAFSMFATSMEQLMAIADAGQIMPPKSTWFEPKLRSGLLVRPLD
jgi:uncharacterized protein (DUF1015 family)